MLHLHRAHNALMPPLFLRRCAFLFPHLFWFNHRPRYLQLILHISRKRDGPSLKLGLNPYQSPVEERNFNRVWAMPYYPATQL